MIGAIVLAAGRSQRMGTQKLLLPLRGKPVIALVVGELLRTSVDEVCVVVGRDAERIKSVLAGSEVGFASNPSSNADMLSSVRCGLRALPVNCEAVLVVLGDQPGVTCELIEALLHEFRTKNSGIVVPRSGERRGHPLLFSARFRDELLSHYEGVGLQGLLAAHPEEVREVVVTSHAELADLDTPADYERMRGIPGG